MALWKGTGPESHFAAVSRNVGAWSAWRGSVGVGAVM